MKYHALFVIFKKATKFEIVVCCTLRVKVDANKEMSLAHCMLGKYFLLLLSSADFFFKMNF